MKTLALTTLCLVLSACASPDQRERDQLTDRIEQRVVLPKGAPPLAAFARHYAFDKNGLVIGIYLRGFSWPNPDDRCEELLKDLSTRQIPCTPDDANGDRTFAGQRRWVEGTNQLPSITDGGCSMVTVIYDQRADAVKDIYCNGYA